MKESLLQSSIETYLAYQENLGKLVYQKNNSGALKTQHGSFIRFGKKGSPDFYVFLKGKVIALEVKNETGRQNQNQKDFQIKFENLAHAYKIVRSIDEVESLLKAA